MTARVANCLPLGNDGKYFLIGASLYTHGNVWGIADPPEDWDVAAQNDPAHSVRRQQRERQCSEVDSEQESLAV